MKTGFAAILDNLQEDRKEKLVVKVPEWAGVPDELLIPDSLALEQCSSSATALLKCEYVPEGCRLADLTGGLGVDSYFFSRKCSQVLYNERKVELFQAVRHNFSALGTGNVIFSSEDVSEGHLDFVREFGPDIIFIDPARRSADGRKVFRLRDCSPDVLSLLDELYSICGTVLLKLSPMADISQLRRELPGLREVRIVGHRGECKELLCLLEKGYDGPLEIQAGELRFTPEQEKESSVLLLDRVPKAGELLFEPSAVLSKAGCYGLLCRNYSLEQLGRDAHLFVGKNFPAEGKIFRILDVFPMGREGLRAAAAACPCAEVSARGLMLSSEELRRKLGCRPSDSCHIFGVGSAAGRLLLCCKKF